MIVSISEPILFCVCVFVIATQAWAWSRDGHADFGLSSRDIAIAIATILDATAIGFMIALAGGIWV